MINNFAPHIISINVFHKAMRNNAQCSKIQQIQENVCCLFAYGYFFYDKKKKGKKKRKMLIFCQAIYGSVLLENFVFGEYSFFLPTCDNSQFLRGARQLISI